MDRRKLTLLIRDKGLRFREYSCGNGKGHGSDNVFGTI